MVSQIAFAGCGIAVGMVPSRAMRFGGGDVVFRPLLETIHVVSIAAAWSPTHQKDLVPLIVGIAQDIGMDIGGARPMLPDAGDAPAKRMRKV